jgi:hypothetical protein
MSSTIDLNSERTERSEEEEEGEEEEGGEESKASARIDDRKQHEFAWESESPSEAAGWRTGEIAWLIHLLPYSSSASLWNRRTKESGMPSPGLASSSLSLSEEGRSDVISRKLSEDVGGGGTRLNRGRDRRVVWNPGDTRILGLAGSASMAERAVTVSSREGEDTRQEEEEEEEMEKATTPWEAEIALMDFSLALLVRRSDCSANDSSWYR